MVLRVFEVLMTGGESMSKFILLSVVVSTARPNVKYVSMSGEEKPDLLLPTRRSKKVWFAKPLDFSWKVTVCLIP